MCVCCFSFLFLIQVSKQKSLSLLKDKLIKNCFKVQIKSWHGAVNYYFHCKLSNKLNLKLESRWWCDDGRWRKSRRPVWNKLSRNKEGRRVLHSLRVFSQVTKLFKVFSLSKHNQLSPEKVWFLLVSFSFFFLNNYFLT